METRKWVRYVNLPALICDNVIGERHSMGHRLFCGMCVMLCGVLIASQAHGLPAVAAVFTDLFGYLIHGVGAVPYVEGLAVILARSR